MLRKIFTYFTLPLLLLLSNSSGSSAPQSPTSNPDGQTGILQKMFVGSGRVTIELDLSRLEGPGSAKQESKPGSVRFEVSPNSFFTILVFDDVLRGLEPGSMALIGENSTILPASFGASSNQLVIESTPAGEDYELVVRDSKTGFVFFGVQGQEYEYGASDLSLKIHEGRLLVTREFATQLGLPAAAGSVVGKISIAATMRAIEVTQLVNGEMKSVELPAVGTRPGPDVIVGELSGLAQFGARSGTQVGLAVGTDSCNPGVENLDWFANPSNDHPVIPQNLYRMSGGGTNDERFEQIGQSSVKHAFTAASSNTCGFGCNGVAGTQLGSGCSDLYSASLNSGNSNNGLGSRAWINPFTGAYPRNDSATPNNSHTGHTHTGPSHRILVEISDLVPATNPGATYWAEGQYVTPHEYVWCQSHPGVCNMYNNVSYHRYNVTNSASPFTFSGTGFSTVRETAAIRAWTGATINQVEPAPGADGIGLVGFKVTTPSAGVWHYEYAVYNQNLDRGFQSFSVPVGAGVTVSNIGFHAPPQHPGWSGNGTAGDAPYSSTPWTPVQAGGSLTWSSETFAQNQNANAIRWGTLYNFRFDSNRPPQAMNATVGFFKAGAPVTVGIQGPSPDGSVTPSPTPTPPAQSPTPTATPTVPPTATPTPSGPPGSPTPTPPVPTPTPHTPTPTPPAPTPTATPTPPAPTPTATPHSPTPTPPVTTPTPTPPVTTPTPPAATPTPTPPLATPTPTPPSATPTPTPIPPAQAVNLSTRMRVQTGDNVGIGGFIITGSAPKHLLLRAIGPSLTGSGVPNALADPVLELHGPGGFTTITNDNWRDDPAQQAAILATGIAPTNNLESAIDTTLNPGAYTAIIRGKNNTSGVALIEVYDLSQAVLAQLANISTRAFVSTGDNIVIAGFTLGGNNGEDKVVVRGLAPAGVSGPLPDPTLELRDANGALIGSNDNWQDNATQAAGLTAANLAPPNTLDAAIMATLPPGLYTALLAGANNGTGVGLVEVYDLGSP
jgi:hypothetical protein